MPATAPYFAHSASFSGDDAAATTCPPISVASSTDASPTPPAAPSTSTVSPRWRSAMVRRVCIAVVCATLNAAASRSSTDSGITLTLVALTTIFSAYAPTKLAPYTWSPTFTPPSALATPSPTAAINPENSLPGTNGAGTCTWYSLLTISTSGKFTAAYAMSTQTSPGPGSGSGSSCTTTASGGPCSRTYAARTATGSRSPSSRSTPPGP